MDKRSENFRSNVISLRISETDRECLKRIVMETNKNISDIMREAMKCYVSNHDDEGQSHDVLIY